MDVALVLVKADGSSKEIKLDRSAMTIGRDESCRLRIPAKSVSRRHCEVKIDDGEVIVTDLGSSNGTFVNGRRVKSTELAPGDLLALGAFVFVVRIDGHPKQIDAKDSYMAASVTDESDESDIDLPAPKPAAGPAASASAKPAPSSKPASGGTGGKPAGKGDDASLSDLLKDFDFGDDDDDEPPTKKK